MRVLHIIPAAFEYFDDIRSESFRLVDGLYKMGVETEAFTLQYGGPTKKLKAEIKENSSSVHTHISSTGAAGLVESFDEFDIIHLHCPFLGAARHILDWKKLHAQTPLIVTYHRDVEWVDTFSLLIKLYNHYYLPRIFRAADVLICNNFDELASLRGSRYIEANKHVTALDSITLEKDEVSPNWTVMEAIAAKTALVYNTLIT